MKIYSYLTFFLLLGASLNLSAQAWPQFDTLYTQPANPTPNDSIMVIYQFTNNYSVAVDSRQVFDNAGNFTIFVCYRDGLATIVEQYRDTVMLAPQAAGTYNIQLLVERGTVGNPNYCVLGNNDIDETRQFTVSPIFTNLTLLNTSSIQLSPNPVREQPLLVETKERIEQVLCYNSTGQLIQQVQGTGQTVLEVPMKDLAKGLYYIHIKTPAGQYIQKVVKQ